MKIGVISSWNESLSLFKFLNKVEHEYIVYYDQIHSPHGDNDFQNSISYVKKWIEILKSKWVEKIILSPIYELYFLQKKEDLVLPLFQNYLFEFVFSNSLVGKIWFFGDFADLQEWQRILSEISSSYKLAENQSKIKKFHFPFKFWAKDVSMWKYFINKLSFSSLMVNKVIKNDLKYFKDANVDSLVPLNYAYFNYQNTIFRFFNYKKQRFHKLEKLEEVFKNFNLNQSKYSISLIQNGHVEFLTREKKFLWLLQRWKNIDIVFEKLS